jgi:peptidoglycan/xylan/chitin deacetylase (PgdA/CDA1 family)
MSISKYIREIFILGISFLGLSFVYRTVCGRKGPLVRVLIFHDVLDAEWFEKMISFLSEQYNVITPKEFAESTFDTERINILITFDDGYASWNRVCQPVLERYGVTALFFINSGIPELYGNEVELQAYLKENLLISPHTTLSWNDVSMLVEAGHTIGGHTIHHPRLSALSEDMQKDEIVSDKEVIENKLGTTVSSFAYPFGGSGDYTEVTKEIVVGVGYTHAFTTSGTFVDHTDNYTISRMCVEDTQSPASLNRWILGGYDIYRMIKSICVR